MIVIVLGAGSLPAALIVEQGRDDAFPAYVVSQTAAHVVVDEVLSDGSLRRREIPRSRVISIIRLVSPERLEALDPAKPQEYREYAEELIEKSADPEARDAALRLFQIAAFIDPDALGSSSLRGMVELARSPEERRRFRALAFLLDPKHDRAILEATAASRPEDADSEARELVLSVFRALRRTDRQVHGQVRREEFRVALQRYYPQISIDEIMAESRRRTGPISADLLQRVLQAEIDELRAQVSMASPKRDSSWSEVLRERGPTAVTPLAIESITEFDPSQNRFRNGQWVR